MKPAQPLLYYITDRRALASADVIRTILAAVEAGVDLIQIREKDLGTRDLLRLVEAAVQGVREQAARTTASTQGLTRVVVNDRLDVALAGEARGVHLGGRSMQADAVRAAVPTQKGFWVGVSCHSPEDVAAAETAGADYALLGPIFETASKLAYGPPLGAAVVERATRHARIPVLALGGITLERVRTCIEAGAAGIAGISIFQQCASLPGRVLELRRLLGQAASPAADLGNA
ncbi:MAG TPA: thiamine phosphate synthase [Terriglobia bacterium]|nr:thiamine phosphate synthase [Terriglobia bacterium]